MRVFDFPFPIEIGSVCDFDFMPDGSSITIQGTDSHQLLLIGEERLALPTGWSSPEFPFVRALPDGRIFVMDTNFSVEGSKNAWILSRPLKRNPSKPADPEFNSRLRRLSAVGPRNFSSSHRDFPARSSTPLAAAISAPRADFAFQRHAQLEPKQILKVDANFEVGPSAVEVVCLWGLIAVAFHPLSAKAQGHQVQPIQRSAVAFYDLTGRLVMGFNTVCAALGVHAENIRCMTALSRSQLLVVPERLSVKGEDIENPIVLFDCATRRPRIFNAPYPRAESCAMSDGLIQLASPEGWEDQIITFDPETKISQHRGEFLGIFRGLESGGFLSQLSSAEYAVIVPGPFAELESPIQTPDFPAERGTGRKFRLWTEGTGKPGSSETLKGREIDIVETINTDPLNADSGAGDTKEVREIKEIRESKDSESIDLNKSLESKDSRDKKEAKEIFEIDRKQGETWLDLQ